MLIMMEQIINEIKKAIGKKGSISQVTIQQ